MIRLEEENLKILDVEDQKNTNVEQDFYELPVQKGKNPLQQTNQDKINLPLWSIEPPLEIRRNEK